MLFRSNVTLTDTNTTLNGNSETYKNIFLYQSMSGDADEGNASFTAKDSTITTNKGDTIFVTNTTATINLENNTFVNNDGDFLRIQTGKWGTSGSNGGNVTLNMTNQKVEGNIIVDGENIENYNKNELAEYRANNVGFIFQFYNILPTLTVLENVEIVKDIVKNPKSAKKILESVGLGEHISKFPNQLSGGEQQRVSIARAIAKDPLLLLCDEPTGALDSKTGVGVLKLLKKQCDANNGENTVIIVTHNSLIAEVADRVIRLKNGKVESNEINENPKNIEEVEW
mgnify:CR=1 FL=1